MNEARWHHEFASHGFSGIDFCLNDHPKGVDVASVMMTTAIEPTVYLNGQATLKETVTVPNNVNQQGFSRQLINRLDHDRYHIKYVSLLESIPRQGTHVISLLDLEDTTFSIMKRHSLASKAYYASLHHCYGSQNQICLSRHLRKPYLPSDFRALYLAKSHI